MRAAQVACAVGLATNTAAGDDEPGAAAAILQARVDQIHNGAPVHVGGEPIASMFVLPDFYERREFRPAWTASESRSALLAAVRDSATDGLDPRDYHVAALDALVQHGHASPETDADFDMLATDAVIRLAYHLRFGKVHAADVQPEWRSDRDVESVFGAPPAIALQRLVDGDLAAGLDGLRPRHPIYAALRQALRTYREIESAGGWPFVAAGPTLKPGAADARLPSLAARLRLEGDLTATIDTVGVYDSTLVAAVRRFQERHGLNADGAVGKGTLRALNTPVATRISQLRLSLERSRLLLHDLPARFVLVNIPAFRVYYVDDSGLRFASRVIVGKPFTQTPSFRAEMTYVVLNPSWTVPPGIMTRDVLPGMAQDPEYLQRKGFHSVGGQIVQPPGPGNPLGRVKLMFPNPHLVYLHDTPQRELFASDRRTFSSGCIRAERALDLAALVLDDSTWSRPQIDAAIATGRTRTVQLARSLPVLITYWTAAIAPGEARPRFYHDVYARDREFLAALASPFRFDPAVAARAAAISGAR